MEKQFQEIIKYEKLVNRGDRVVLAVSGGVDSVVMLNLFSECAKSAELDLVVAHVNHGVRKLANRDERFVMRLSKRLKLPFVAARLTGTKNAGEEVLREKRYRFLNNVARDLGAQSIAVAHHRDDNIETAFMNLIRGASYKGLSGMKLKSGKLIRPLLPFSRGDILKYAASRNLNHVDDETNADSAYMRNRVRNRLIPYIEKNVQKDFKDVFFRFMMLSRELDDYMEQNATAAIAKIQFRDGSLDLSAFRALPRALQKEVLKIKVRQTMGDLRNVGSVHLEAAVRALGGEQTPKTIEFPRGLKILKRSAKVSFEISDGK